MTTLHDMRAIEVELMRLDAQSTMSVQITVPTDQAGRVLAEIVPEVRDYLERAGVAAAGPPFLRYHGHDGARSTVEAGVPVLDPVAACGRIAGGRLPGGLVAVARHKGPYQSLPRAVAALERWLGQAGRQVAGAPWQYLWIGPDESPDPALWQTQLIWPLGD